MFPCSLKQGSCSLVPYDIFPLFPCSPKPLGDPHLCLTRENTGGQVSVLALFGAKREKVQSEHTTKKRYAHYLIIPS